MRKNIFRALPVLVFIFCVWVGLHIASRRMIWVDETNSLNFSIQKQSYLGLVTNPFLKQQVEGNASPMFYLIQKAWIDLIGYEVPAEHQGKDSFADPSSQWRLRVPSIIFMSLAIALIGWYFLSFSLGTFFVALVSSLSSTLLWVYWAEMRPYSLWVFLSVAQIIVLLREQKSETIRSWQLALVHLALSFTIVFSLPQIVFAALLDFYFKRNRSWLRIGGAFLLPVGIILAYASVLPKYTYFFANDAANVFFSGVPKSRIALALLMMVVAWGGHLRWREKASLGFFGAMIISAAAILGAFAIIDAGPTGTFQVAARYFIFAIPSSIFFVGHAYEFLRKPENRPGWRIGAYYLFLFLLVYQAGRAYLDVRIG